VAEFSRTAVFQVSLQRFVAPVCEKKKQNKKKEFIQLCWIFSPAQHFSHSPLAVKTFNEQSENTELPGKKATLLAG